MEQDTKGNGNSTREHGTRKDAVTSSSRQSKPRNEESQVVQDIQLDPFQQEILDHKGNILLCTGRQVGKTTIFSRKACEHMINNKGARIIVVSLTEDQAQLIIIMMLNYFEKHYKGYLAKPFSKNITKNKIVLTNKSQVLSRPVGNTGDAVRGFTGDILIIDEASRMPESVFTAAKPTLLTTGGLIWMCSTPFGKQGYFYESFLNKHNRFKVFHISSEDVITNRPVCNTWTQRQHDEGIRMLDEEKKDMGTIAYSQEYLGMFMEDLHRFFSDEWIQEVCILKRNPQRFRDKQYFLGLDIARLGADEGTFEIIEKIHTQGNPIFRQIESIVTKKQLTTQTFQRIVDLNQIYDFKRIGIDAGSGSLGVGILDFLLKEPSVSKKMVALNNRTVMLDKYGEHSRGLLKEDMHELLRAFGERRLIQLLNDEELILSLKSIQIEYVMKQGQQTKIKIFGRYSHIVEGIIRALWLANSKSINTFIDWV